MMDKDLVQIAIIGCGAVTERGHLPATTKISNCRVTLLVDNNLEHAKKLSNIYNISTISDDYHAAVDHANAAIVALPHHLHAPVSCELLEAGLHVLVEKPMALSSSECNTMLAAAKKGRAVLAVGLMRRFLNSIQFTHWLLNEGILGQIKEFDVQEGNVYNWPVTSDFFFHRSTAGGGVLFDTGAHTLDLLLYLLGDVVDLEYYDDSYGGIEADCKLYLKMQSGAKGNIELSRSRDLRNTAIIKGEHGILEVHLRKNWVLLNSCDKALGFEGYGIVSGSTGIKEQKFSDLFQPQLEDWIASIQKKRVPTVPGEEAMRSIALVEACYAHRKQLELPWVQPERKILQK